MDASRSIPGGDRIAQIDDCKHEGRSLTIPINNWDPLPLHPHNAPLQLWLELGAVGVVIFIGLLGLLIWRWQRDFAKGNGLPLIAGVLTAIFVVYNISFGLWQGWLIFSLILLFAIIRNLRLSYA